MAAASVVASAAAMEEALAAVVLAATAAASAVAEAAGSAAAEPDAEARAAHTNSKIKKGMQTVCLHPFFCVTLCKNGVMEAARQALPRARALNSQPQ